MSWQKKTSRFVLFYDILGFKDAVFRQTHTEIYEKLEALNDSVKQYTGEKLEAALSEYKVQKDQIHPVIFSDSIIVFTKSDLLADATVILGVAHAIHGHALSLGLAIKGAISYGEISVDLEKSIFFGQPLIDAYLLHEELQLLSVVLDHNAENKIKSYTESELPLLNSLLITEEVQMKCGKVKHTITKPSVKTLLDRKIDVENLYKTVSGKPRQYLDNTIKFYEQLLLKK